jgi:hypothetical protein
MVPDVMQKSLGRFFSILQMLSLLSLLSTSVVEGEGEKFRRQRKPSSREYAVRTCRAIFSRIESHLLDYFEKNRIDFEALEKRVLSNPKITREAFYAIFRDLVGRIIYHEATIRDTTLYDGNFAFPILLRGVTLWASSYEDLHRAVEILGYGKRPSSDITIEFFVSRMAWMASQFDNRAVKCRRRNPDFDIIRHAAIRDLLWFDEFYREYYNIAHSGLKGPAHIYPLRESILLGLRRRKVTVPFEPVSAAQLLFNNGRHYPWFLDPAEIWAAQVLSELNEFMLGLGDRSVRQFTPMFEVFEDRMNISPPGCDYFSAYFEYGWHYALRDLKFASPDAQVPIEKAVDQLKHSWWGINANLGSLMTLGRAEIVVPQRWRTTLGKGYFIGKEVGQNLNEILYGQRPLYIHLEGQRVPVRLRQIPISQSDYWRLFNESRRHDR